MKNLDKDCSFEASNEYMSILVNEKFIDVQDHGKQESLFVTNKRFSRIGVHKFTQTGVAEADLGLLQHPRWSTL